MSCSNSATQAAINTSRGADATFRTFDEIFAGAYDFWDPALGYSLRASSFVTNWVGQITGTNDLAEAVEAAQPTRNATDANFNNKPTITFIAGDKLLDATLAAGVASGDRLGLFWVGKSDDTLTGWRHLAFFSEALSTSDRFNLHTNSGSNFYSEMNLSDGDPSITGPTLDTNPHYIHMLNAADEAVLSVDGTEYTDTETGTIDWTLDHGVIPYTSGAMPLTLAFLGLAIGVTDEEIAEWNTSAAGRWAI